MIGRAAIFDEENREYALMRCREIWSSKYPNESFENEASWDSKECDPVREDVFKEVEEKQRLLCSKFAEAYRSEVVYLIAARQRYKAFLYMVQRFAHQSSTRLVPTSDILLMWLTHQVILLFDFNFIPFYVWIVLKFPYLPSPESRILNATALHNFIYCVTHLFLLLVSCNSF